MLHLRNRKWALLALALGAPVAWVLWTFWKMGSRQCAPRPEIVGELPADLAGETVHFTGSKGSLLRGWFLPGVPGKGAVVLMHPVRANRLWLLGRARFLNAAGYAVLLFDFQAHGESEGRVISFGHLESEDARAAVEWLRNRVPGEKIVALGASLGGAASLLASPPLAVDGIILEMVYPTIEAAIGNRVGLKFGRWGRPLSFLMAAQLRPRVGVRARELRPIARVKEVTVPKLFIAGAQDRHTPLRESQALFEAAREPKGFWAVESAEHEDLHGFAGEEFERRVLEFLGPISSGGS